MSHSSTFLSVCGTWICRLRPANHAHLPCTTLLNSESLTERERERERERTDRRQTDRRTLCTVQRELVSLDGTPGHYLTCLHRRINVRLNTVTRTNPYTHTHSNMCLFVCRIQSTHDRWRQHDTDTTQQNTVLEYQPYSNMN